MCGIAGVLSLNESYAVAPEILARMSSLLAHRGPDATGIYCGTPAGPVGLAHTRLSIIDLAGGAQPMSSADGSLRITFNGEIFNYLELRDDLLRKGHRFASHSDTEVILHMYAEHGEDCVRHFNGQWAFAIWDAQRKSLFLSRDRVGVRPLFYAKTARSFIFSSEIKALLAHPEVSATIDPTALDEVFTFWCPLPPRTMIDGVQELPPGHSMIVHEGSVRVWPHWTLDYSAVDPEADEHVCAERLLELLRDSTRIRLRSDVPVAAYLSGGLDSSVITALTKEVSGRRLKTFSVQFEDPEFDESPYQNDVIRFLETDHEAIRCTHHDICDAFPHVIWHTEKPILRTAPAPMFLLSQLVHKDGFKVVLTGEGADEFLGGYDIFKEAKIRRFWARNPASRRRPLLLKRLYPYLPNLHLQSDAYLKAFFRVRPAELSAPFFSHLPRWELTSRLKTFYSADLKHQLEGFRSYSDLEEHLPVSYSGWDDMSKAQYLEASTLLPGYILSSQGDRMAMAHSVEGRFPFLDYRVVEFASHMRPELRMKVLDEKHLLKAAAGHLIPASVRNRPKQPYRAPDVTSFFDSNSRQWRADYVGDMLSPARLKETGYFNPSAVHRLMEKARSGELIGTKDNMALVGILSTQLFADQFSNIGRHLK